MKIITIIKTRRGEKLTEARINSANHNSLHFFFPLCTRVCLCVLKRKSSVKRSTLLFPSSSKHKHS
jgi:hypothetical protein